MIISAKHKFVCFNPPKTGTAYRELVFQNHCDFSVKIKNLPKLFRHVPANWLSANLEINNTPKFIELKDFFKFTFVRNPWERYASWFNMVSVQESIPNELKEESFLKFLKDKCSTNIQEDYCIWDKRPLDYIGECNSQEQQLRSLEKKLDINFSNDILSLEEYIKKQPTKITRFNHPFNWRKLYTEEGIELVQKSEKYVIDLKKYTFD